MINDLINPVLSKMNEDREVILSTKLRFAIFEERLAQAEYILLVNESKPKIFEEIFDQMANIKADVRTTEQSILQKVDLMGVKVDSMQETVQECKKMSDFLSQKAESFDEMLSTQRNTTNHLQERLSQECSDLKNFMDDKFKEVKSDNKKTDSIVIQNQMKVKEFSEIIDRVESYQRDLNLQNAEVKKSVGLLREEKLDSVKFEKEVAQLNELITAVKYAAQDNYRSLLSTDNYLEKYQPFFMQHMISDSIAQVVKKDKVLKLKEYEHNKFRDWHKQILNDTGLPQLQKRHYMLPGQSQPVENNNKDFIQELGEKYISMDWFLGKSQNPYLNDEDGSQESDSSGTEQSIDRVNFISPPNIQKNQSLFGNKQMQQSQHLKIVEQPSNLNLTIGMQHSIPKPNTGRSSSKHVLYHTIRPNSRYGNNSPINLKSQSPPANRRMTVAQSKASTTIVGGERGLEKLKDNYLMGMEDLEPDFAQLLREDHIKIEYSCSDIDRLKKELHNLKEQTSKQIKAEIGKFKVEIKSCLNEHLAVISEIHSDIEKERKERKQDQNDLMLHITKLQKIVGVENPNSPEEPFIIDAKERKNQETLENLYDSLKLQNILNHEFFKVIFLPFETKKQHIHFNFKDIPQAQQMNSFKQSSLGSAQHKRVQSLSNNKMNSDLQQKPKQNTQATAVGLSHQNLNLDQVQVGLTPQRFNDSTIDAKNFNLKNGQENEIDTQVNFPTPQIMINNPTSQYPLDQVEVQTLKIDCHQMIQMIDSLIKGCDEPNLKDIAKKIKRQQNLSIKQSTKIIQRNQLTIDNKDQISNGWRSVKNQNLMLNSSYGQQQNRSPFSFSDFPNSPQNELNTALSSNRGYFQQSTQIQQQEQLFLQSQNKTKTLMNDRLQQQKEQAFDRFNHTGGSQLQNISSLRKERYDSARVSTAGAQVKRGLQISTNIRYNNGIEKNPMLLISPKENQKTIFPQSMNLL
eukprot:403376352